MGQIYRSLIERCLRILQKDLEDKTEVESVHLGNTYIADMDKCPQDKCCLDKCHGYTLDDLIFVSKVSIPNKKTESGHFNSECFTFFYSCKAEIG